MVTQRLLWTAGMNCWRFGLRKRKDAHDSGRRFEHHARRRPKAVFLVYLMAEHALYERIGESDVQIFSWDRVHSVSCS